MQPDQARPNKQCQFCNYLPSPSGSNGQSGPGVQGGQGGQP